ncbi:MAG TPA: hypothetical protein VGS22_16950 [Thermoanaerobaculia bacterium]|jgi:hypothetical protein|nr:hypothetical protein [Thermoanaerobaculia bacterium]
MRSSRWTFLSSFSAVLLVAFALGAPSTAWADSGADFSGTFTATLPERAEILNLHADGTAEITLSDQVTSGAGGFTFSDSFGSWKKTGPRRLVARFLNLNFDVSTPAATYSGVAVVDYVFQFAPNLKTFAASCQGKIFPPGADPFNPASVPVTTFDCAYLDGFHYHRMPPLP